MSEKNNEDYIRGYEEGKEWGIKQGKYLQKATWDWEEAIGYWMVGLVGITVTFFGLFLIWGFIHWAAQQDVH